jgi:glucose-6-phosphate dehydrogenase assembly protein OpcA
MLHIGERGVESILTCIGITGEVARPSYKGVTLMLTRGNRPEADGANNRRVAQGRLRGDNGVGEVVVDALFRLLDQESS